MEIINLDIEKNEYKNIAIALGNFDGIHLGHQELIKEVVRESKKNNFKPSILLFENHTKSTIYNDTPDMLTTNFQKYEIVKKLGIEIIYTIEFTKEIMGFTEEEFINKILIDKLNCKFVVVGFDYRFGYKAKGTSESLKKIGDKYGIKTEIINPIKINNKIISSSYIRELIKGGKVLEASELLGRNYKIKGVVVSGANRGTGLGFPTANLKYDTNYILPMLGVYKTKTIIDGQEYLSMTDIGYNPTFQEDHIKLETFILDFSENIYGKEIEVEFVKFLRDGVKFNTKEELIDQLKIDEKIVRYG